MVVRVRASSDCCSRAVSRAAAWREAARRAASLRPEGMTPLCWLSEELQEPTAREEEVEEDDDGEDVVEERWPLWPAPCCPWDEARSVRVYLPVEDGPEPVCWPLRPYWLRLVWPLRLEELRLEA